MTQKERNHFQIKCNILKTINEYHEGFFQFKKLHLEKGIHYSDAYTLVDQLVKEGLIEYPRDNKDFLSLTKDGKRAVDIGYGIFLNELEEKEKYAKQYELEKKDLELNALRFNNKYKWMIIISFFISFLSLLVTFLTWYYPKG